MQFIPTSDFEKRFSKLPADIRSKVHDRLNIFSINEFDPILNNHKLKHDFEGYRSINITGDWRIIFRKLEDKVVLLYKVGTHHQLFGK